MKNYFESTAQTRIVQGIVKVCCVYFTNYFATQLTATNNLFILELLRTRESEFCEWERLNDIDKKIFGILKLRRQIFIEKI